MNDVCIYVLSCYLRKSQEKMPSEMFHILRANLLVLAMDLGLQ